MPEFDDDLFEWFMVIGGELGAVYELLQSDLQLERAMNEDKAQLPVMRGMLLSRTVCP